MVWEAELSAELAAELAAEIAAELATVGGPIEGDSDNSVAALSCIDHHSI